MSKEEFILNVNKFYNKNGKITIRDFRTKNNLPSITYIEKTFGIKSIIDIKEFCGIPISEKDKKLSNRKPYTIEEVRQLFESRHCVLLSTELTDGIYSYLDYICECGNISVVKLSDFIAKNVRCKKCGIEKNREKRRISYEELKQTYENNGCELLSNYSEYTNNESVLKFKCSCGNIEEKRFHTFKSTPKCSKCHTKTELEKHYAWKGGITSINEYLRKHIEKWKFDSAKNGNFKSDISGLKFEVIHHVNKNFSDITIEVLNELKLEVKPISEYSKEELKKITELCLEYHYKYGYGVCLTEEEHKLFHIKYGNKNNTIEQYNEFKNQYYKLISTTIESYDTTK